MAKCEKMIKSIKQVLTFGGNLNSEGYTPTEMLIRRLTPGSSETFGYKKFYGITELTDKVNGLKFS